MRRYYGYMNNIELSAQQKRIIAAGITTFAAIVIIATAVVCVIYTARFFDAFDSVFLPLAVAAVFAMVLDPWYDWLQSRLPDAVALILVFLSVLLPLGLMAGVFGTLIVTQLSDLLSQLPELWASIVSWFQENRPRLDAFLSKSELRSQVTETLKNPSGPVSALADHLARSIASAGSNIAAAIFAFLGWVIVPVYLAFFLMMPRLRPESLKREHFPFLKTGTAEDAIYLIREFFQLVVVFFRGQIVIALLQGILFAIGFSLAGLEYGAVLGLMLGFLNIVPYLGSMVGLSVCLPMAWFQDGGGMTLLALVLLVFMVVQMIEGYLLTPKIMGDATGLNPLAIIVGIFFWGAALNGILGMILAIPLTAFAVVIWRLAKEKYIGQIL